MSTTAQNDVHTGGTFAAAQIGPQDYTYRFVVKVFKIWRASPGVFAYRLVPQLRTLAVHLSPGVSGFGECCRSPH